ncbi:MAG: sigma-54-dependent Fis family transcriptional regulator [Deltaproteobacteria bacterium]|nr:sigma-54-dependent Fis family transcriptional regulator [Deltaproteobacteria bacterium]
MPRRSPARATVVLEPAMASPVMRAFDRILRAVAAKEVTVTLVGESGSGKEVMARRLHDLSPRRAGPFIPINCAAIPEALFESELFGHERGAYTGATERGRGKIEAATGGTLFLDEVAEMPFSLQPKLLRFLETHRFMRVGGTKKLEVDTRVVLATLRPLEDEVRAGRFRADLYYRIQGIVLTVPPLRDRRRDIPVLLDTFLAQLAAVHDCTPPRLSRSARAALVAYDWPGNVRQLRNVIELVTILRSGQQVGVHDLPTEVIMKTSAPIPHELAVDTSSSLDEIIDRVIDHVIAEERGNLTRAAQRLEISIRTLQRRRRT